MFSKPVRRAIVLVAAITLLGTAWSVVAGTYLDTSNHLVTNLPHPHSASSYFADKKNPFNTIFVKRAWGWTTVALAANLYASPRAVPTRVWRWVLATACWASFALWFFGPSLSTRFAVLSGAECIVVLPAEGAGAVTVPQEFCVQRQPLSVNEHAALFQQAFIGNELPNDWRAIPKLTRGHDISGHVFLLSLSILTLVDDLATAAPFSGELNLQSAAAGASALLCALWCWMLLMTSVYFHAPIEKISGLVVGVSAYLITKVPPPFDNTARAVQVPQLGKKDQ